VSPAHLVGEQADGPPVALGEEPGQLGRLEHGAVRDHDRHAPKLGHERVQHRPVGVRDGSDGDRGRPVVRAGFHRRTVADPMPGGASEA
jgi:hypothetical protein